MFHLSKPPSPFPMTWEHWAFLMLVLKYIKLKKKITTLDLCYDSIYMKTICIQISVCGYVHTVTHTPRIWRARSSRLSMLTTANRTGGISQFYCKQLLFFNILQCLCINILLFKEKILNIQLRELLQSFNKYKCLCLTCNSETARPWQVTVPSLLSLLLLLLLEGEKQTGTKFIRTQPNTHKSKSTIKNINMPCLNTGAEKTVKELMCVRHVEPTGEVPWRWGRLSRSLSVGRDVVSQGSVARGLQKQVGSVKDRIMPTYCKSTVGSDPVRAFLFWDEKTQQAVKEVIYGGSTGKSQGWERKMDVFTAIIIFSEVVWEEQGQHCGGSANGGNVAPGTVPCTRQPGPWGFVYTADEITHVSSLPSSSWDGCNLGPCCPQPFAHHRASCMHLYGLIASSLCFQSGSSGRA